MLHKHYDYGNVKLQWQCTMAIFNTMLSENHNATCAKVLSNSSVAIERHAGGISHTEAACHQGVISAELRAAASAQLGCLVQQGVVWIVGDGERWRESWIVLGGKQV